MGHSLSKVLASGQMTALIKYIIAAILARTATGGATVAIVLLSRNFGADGALTGALTACLTAPHILGPVYGRWLEKSTNPFRVIAASCVLFTAFFSLAIASLHWQTLWLAVVSLLIAGGCSSFLMGGLSTQVNQLVENDATVRRKAQSWDTVTYGLGLTVGPMLIAVMSSLYSIELSTAVLSCLPFVAAFFILSLPKPKVQSKKSKAAVPNIKQVVKTLWYTPSLRTTLLMTSGAAFSFAALPVLAVYFSEYFSQGQESGAYLVTLYGVGCLCGAASLIVKPLAQEALVLLRNVGNLLIGCLIFVSLSQSFAMSMLAYWLCGVVNSVFFAVTIAARSEYSPEKGAAQIYMWVAAAKITAASLGALAAGVLVDHFITLPLLASVTVLSATILVCFFFKRNSRGNFTQITKQD